MSDYLFAKRTNWSMKNNPLSDALEQLKASNVNILDLTESNPTRCGFQYPIDQLSSLTDPRNFIYAPQDKGMAQARQAIANYYGQRNIKVDPENVVLVSSTSEGYSFLLKLLTNSGDHVLIPSPSYPLFQFLLGLHDVNFDYYPLVYEGAWKIDQKALCTLITPQTRCVILVNPNNPTGSYVSSEDLKFLNEVCQQHRMAIIADEVFFDYRLNTRDAAPESLIGNTQVPTFVLSGISKILGLPQMKLSWIALNGPQDFIPRALERLEIISDTYLSVNTPVQQALARWLSKTQDIQQQIIRRVQENLNFLRGQRLQVLSVQGGWYAIIHEPSIKFEEQMVLKLLEEDHVLVHPGYFFDFLEEGYLVVSLLPEEKIFKEAVERILRRTILN